MGIAFTKECWKYLCFGATRIASVILRRHVVNGALPRVMRGWDVMLGMSDKIMNLPSLFG